MFGANARGFESLGGLNEALQSEHLFLHSENAVSRTEYHLCSRVMQVGFCKSQQIHVLKPSDSERRT